jgi:hypothetical protein
MGAIAADSRKYGGLPDFVDGPHSYFIASALRARSLAERATDTPSLQRKREELREQQERANLLALAEKMGEVFRGYRNFQERYVAPSPPPRGQQHSSGSPRWPKAQPLLEWLEREAQELRQLAEKVSYDGARDWDRIPVNVSRQSGGKGKRIRSREIGVFMQTMVSRMYEACGKPRHHAVATITNIAFPDAYVTAEDVRSACKPTTRAGRRRRTGAPSKQ